MLGEVNINITNLVHTNLRNPLQPRAHFHLDLKPLQKGDNPATNPRIITTDGLYHLRYMPSSLKKKREDRFVLRGDIFKENFIRFKNWEDYEELVNTNEKVAFIQKYIKITKEDFEMAQLNVGMTFYFGLDTKQYVKDVAKQSGTEPDFSILRNPEMNEVEKVRHKTFLEVNHVYDVEV